MSRSAGVFSARGKTRARDCLLRGGLTLASESAAGVLGGDPHAGIELTDTGLKLSRDVLGGRSMYFTRDSDGTVFAASHLETLLSMLPSAPRRDASSLASFVAFGCAPAGATLFENVERVRSDEICFVRPDGTTRTAREIVPELEREERANAERPVDELAESLWATIVSAVEKATRGHRHIAVLGGGGLDSGALLAASVALARGANPREVTNVFMAFEGPESDVPYHRDLTESLGITPIVLRPGDVPAPSDICLDAQPYPFATLGFDLEWHRRAREAGATVVLTGAGGDEILGGDLRFLAARALRRPLAALRDALALEVPWPTTPASRLREWIAQPLAKPYVPQGMLARHLERQWHARIPWLGPAAHACVRRAAVAQARERRDLSATGRYLHEAHSPTWCDFADARTQLEGATGVRREDPLLSPSVLRFVSSVPLRHVADDHRHRGLLRRALRGRVPESLRLRSGKAYFEPALYEALAKPAFSTMLSTFSEAGAVATMGLIDRPRYSAAHRALTNTPGAGISWCDLWQTIGAEAFARRYP